MQNKPILFRCSRLGALVTEPKLKADKEAGNLSETAKTFIEEMWLRDEYGFDEPVMSDEMMKGLINEDDSIGLTQKVLGGSFRLKNKEHYSNDFLKGTPDIVLSDTVEDLKTSWSLKTFFNAELSKDYYWQLIGYMALTGKTHARLIYCLTNTPPEIVEKLKLRVYYQFGSDSDNPHYIEMSKQIERNHNFDNIPDEKKVKVFSFDFSQTDYDLLCSKIVKAREYYNSLSL